MDPATTPATNTESAAPENGELRAKSGASPVNAGAVPELVVYGEVGWEVCGAEVKRWLDGLGDGVTEISVRINSPGGAVSEGVAVYNLLSEHRAKVVVTVDGFALSAASVIAMAGDEIRMAGNSMMMIHEAHAMCCGPAADHEGMAVLLRKLNKGLVSTYATRTGMERAEVERLVSAETWMTAAEALELGFATSILPGKEPPRPEASWGAKASSILSAYKRLPDALQRVVDGDDDTEACISQRLPEAPRPPEQQAAVDDEAAADTSVPVEAGCDVETVIEPVKKIKSAGRVPRVLSRSPLVTMAASPALGGLFGKNK